MRACFDIDGTLCTNTNGKYREAKPYPEMIRLVNELYDNGWYIIIHTARGGGKFDGKIGLINKQWYAVTQGQLISWGVKYHELHLGKILSDFYIDDKALRVDEDGSSVDYLREVLIRK